MDLVFIDGVEASTTIGVYDHERHTRQTLVIDLQLGCDMRPAAREDAFEMALDYDAISRRVLAFVESTSCRLLETLAEKLADLLFQEYPVLHVRVKISKPGAVEIAQNVGVIIERERAS